MKLEIFRYAASPIKMNVKEGEQVAIMTDSKIDPLIQEALITAVYHQGATPVMILIPPASSFGNEPPAIAAEAILKSDIVISACSTAMTHTDAIRSALKKGVRYLAMGGITVNTITSGAATADYGKIKEISELIAERLASTEEIRVTTDNGTDITFSSKGRPAFPLTGSIEPRRGIAAFPDGEVAMSPLEGSANGIIVIDGTMHHIGKINTPIRLTVTNGRVEEIEGGEEAEKLRRFLESNGDEQSYNLAEFAFGTNGKARLNGNAQESKKILGTVHFAIGDSQTLGGSVYSKTHLDGLVLKPNVYLDGVQVNEDGILLESKFKGGDHS